MNSTDLSSGSHTVIDHATAAIDQASDLSHRSADAVREGVQHMREKAHKLSDHAVCYIKDEPVKSVLIAAAAGAATMGLLSLMVRGSGRG